MISNQKTLVETIVSKRIIEALNYCRDLSSMIYVSGCTGRGKTFTSQWWSSQPENSRAKYLRAPSNCSRRALVRLLCQACGVASTGATLQMEDNLKRSLGPRDVIIVDEAGHLLKSTSGAIELMRDLHDSAKCGVALIFTDVYIKQLRNGHTADYFEQFLGRLEFQVEIPKLPRRDEVRAVVASYVIKPSEELVSYALGIARNREGKLRTLFTDLNRADQLAKNEDRAMNLADLKLAVQWRQSGGAWPEDC